MTPLLIKNTYILTMDDHLREIPDGGLFVRDGVLEQAGATGNLPQLINVLWRNSPHLHGLEQVEDMHLVVENF